MFHRHEFMIIMLSVIMLLCVNTYLFVLLRQNSVVWISQQLVQSEFMVVFENQTYHAEPSSVSVARKFAAPPATPSPSVTTTPGQSVTTPSPTPKVGESEQEDLKLAIIIGVISGVILLAVIVTIVVVVSSSISVLSWWLLLWSGLRFQNCWQPSYE